MKTGIVKTISAGLLSTSGLVLGMLLGEQKIQAQQIRSGIIQSVNGVFTCNCSGNGGACGCVFS